MSDNLTIYQFVDAMIAKGYATIPGYIGRHGNTTPAPYGNGQIYTSDCRCDTPWGKSVNPWDRADMIGIRLDNTILVDYDGNKEIKPDLSVSQLAKQLNMPTVRDALVQWGVTDDGKYNGSFHFLFLLPAKLNRDNFYASQDGKFTGIDIKTENQMLWIKPHKVQNFPDKKDLPAATMELINLLRLPPAPEYVPVNIRDAGHNQKRGTAWLAEVCARLAGMGKNSGRNREMNQMALAAIRYTLANEIPQGMAESSIKQAALSSGLTPGEIRATWNSAKKKAIQAGPKNLIDNRG